MNTPPPAPFDKKVIVLDCDNTLWGGILGEDGLSSIVCGPADSDPVFHPFQTFLVHKKSEGFLLCLCSKNNESEVLEAIRLLNMPLKTEDFVARQVNWIDKITNLRILAKELNLGLDSFIFVDDSPYEIEAVKTLLPEVSALPFVATPEGVRHLMENSLFHKRMITGDDLHKTEQYQAEQRRKQVATAAPDSTSTEDFMRKHLQIKLDFRVNDDADALRLAQLTEKTNQFNFNKHPYSVDEIKRFMTPKYGRVFSLKATDLFGDYGTIGLAILLLEQEGAVLDTFLLSCRAMGRLIEHDFYEFVMKDCLQHNTPIRTIRFLQTERNPPAQDFFKQIKYDRFARNCHWVIEELIHSTLSPSPQTL